MAQQTFDPYAVLGVDQNASAEQVAEAHRRLAKRHHPDINPDATSTEQMRRINAARQLLSNPARRARYDQRRERSRSAGSPRRAGPAAGRAEWPPRFSSTPSWSGGVYAETDTDPWAAWRDRASTIERPRREPASLERQDAFGAAGCALLLLALLLLSLLTRIPLLLSWS